MELIIDLLYLWGNGG